MPEGADHVQFRALVEEMLAGCLCRCPAGTFGVAPSQPSILVQWSNNFHDSSKLAYTAPHACDLFLCRFLVFVQLSLLVGTSWDVEGPSHAGRMSLEVPHSAYRNALASLGALADSRKKVIHWDGAPPISRAHDCSHAEVQTLCFAKMRPRPESSVVKQTLAFVR